MVVLVFLGGVLLSFTFQLLSLSLLFYKVMLVLELWCSVVVWVRSGREIVEVWIKYMSVYYSKSSP